MCQYLLGMSNLDRSFTSVVNGHCQNSFRDDTCGSFQFKDMVNNRSYASVVGSTASNTTKDNTMTVHTSPPRGGASYCRNIVNDDGAGKNKHPGNSDSNPANKMGQEMAIPLIPVSMTPKAIFDKKQYHDSERGNKIHAENGHSGKIFDINGLDEKYLTSILLNTPKKKMWKNSDHPMVKAWKDQTDFEFGFIPLSDLHESDSRVINHLQKYCPIETHKIVAGYGKPNYLGARIKVDTQLNLQMWYQELRDYWDQQLLDFLTFGFPLDFNRNAPLHWEGENHKSALEYPNYIEAYLKDAQFKAIVSPFEQHPCKNGHISPFMTRDKPGSEHRRVIIDLSWPIGCSVNAGIDKDSYLGTDFALVLPTVDNIIDQLKTLGRGANLYKIDISRAFRHIKVDPLDYDLLGLHWRDVYVDTCIPFGSCHGSQIFQRISNAVCHIMRRHGHKVINYVDDYVGFSVPFCND